MIQYSLNTNFFILLSLSLVGFVSAASGPPCSSPDAIAANFIYIKNIPEDYPVGTPLIRLNFYGSSSEISVQNSSYSPYLYFDTTSLDIVVVKRLKVTLTQSQILFCVKCTVKSTGSVNNLTVIIGLLDVNDHPPVFVNAPYSVNVSELTPVGTKIISTISATDADPSDSGYLGFYIADGPDSDGFYFSSLTVGEIVLNKSLSYDQTPIINLTLLVKDNIVGWKTLGKDQPQFTATTSLVINVIAAYDENPIFSESAYSGYISSTAEIGSEVELTFPIYASSARRNSSCVYTIVDGDDGGRFFSINSTSGQLFVAKPLNSSRQLAFQIQATEEYRRHLYSRVLVQISVNRTDDYFPVFLASNYIGTIMKGMPAGTLVIKVEARTLAKNERITYSFLNPTSDFSIDTNSGEIRTTKKLMYNAQTSNYSLIVVANTSSFSNQASAHISVVERLTMLIQFNNFYYVFNVSKSSKNIGKVEATAYDSSGQINYRLYDNLHDSSTNLKFTDQMAEDQNANSLFTIGSDGMIMKLTDADLTEQSYMLVALAEFVDHVSGSVLARDSAVVDVRTDVVVASPAVSSSSDRISGAEIGLIVLAIVCGILLILLIAMIVYMCRRSTIPTIPTTISTALSGACQTEERKPRVYIEESQHQPNRFHSSKSKDTYDVYNQSTPSPAAMATATLRRSFQTGEYVHYNDDTDSEDAQRHLCSSGRDMTSSTFGHTQAIVNRGNGSDFRPADQKSNKSSVSSISPSASSSQQQRASLQQMPDTKYRYSDETMNSDSNRSGSNTLAKRVAPLPPAAGPPRSALVNNGGARPPTGHPTIQQMPSFRSDYDYGTSSTETLVQPAVSPVVSPVKQPNNVQFLESNLDYTSSQETFSASMNPMPNMASDDTPRITVYY